MNTTTRGFLIRSANGLELMVTVFVSSLELVITDMAGGKRSRRKPRAPRPQRVVVYREQAPRLIYVKAA